MAANAVESSAVEDGECSKQQDTVEDDGMICHKTCTK